LIDRVQRSDSIIAPPETERSGSGSRHNLTGPSFAILIDRVQRSDSIIAPPETERSYARERRTTNLLTMVRSLLDNVSQLLGRKQSMPRGAAPDAPPADPKPARDPTS
ncbi:MAG: hypothetical protein AAFO77_14765, partial [Pseudomonadota bacterium]